MVLVFHEHWIVRGSDILWVRESEPAGPRYDERALPLYEMLVFAFIVLEGNKTTENKPGRIFFHTFSKDKKWLWRRALLVGARVRREM